MLLLGLMFRPHYGQQSTGVLLVRVISAKLPTTTDTFVTMTLLPNKTQNGSQTTLVKSHAHSPIWNQIFAFQNVALANLKSYNVLQVTLSDCTGKKSIVAGFLRLGPTPKEDVKLEKWMDSNEEECKHWKMMLGNCGMEVKMWHALSPWMEQKNRIMFLHWSKRPLVPQLCNRPS